MMQNNDGWSRTVFRVRSLPNSAKTFEDVASLLSQRLSDIQSDDICVYSLATTLNSWENPRSKVATVMFQTLPSLIQQMQGKDEWSIPGGSILNDGFIMDTNFMGMTPLNDVEPASHLFE